jgi:hypothetical protein
VKAWWIQRASAVYMLAFVIFLLATFALDPLHDYAPSPFDRDSGCIPCDRRPPAESQ